MVVTMETGSFVFDYWIIYLNQSPGGPGGLADDVMQDVMIQRLSRVNAAHQLNPNLIGFVT